MTGAATCVRADDGRDAQQGLMAGKRDADVLLSTSTNANLADEALYRHYPPVNVNRPAGGSTGSEADGSILDTANTDTFETLNQKLASRWCSSSAQPSAPASSSCCSKASNGGNAMQCLTDKVQHQGTPASVNSSHQPSPLPPSPANGCGPRQQQQRQQQGSCGSAPNSQLLFLVRHGETDYNKAGRLQGRGINAHLNSAGLAQAQGLGRFVRNVPFDTVTSSSLHRAHETAMLVAENNDTCVKRAQENGHVPTPASPTTIKPNDTSSAQGQEEDGPASAAEFCCGDKAQVRVKKLEGLEELSWGELEGKDSKLEPSKGRLADLKRAWDDGIFERAADGGESLIEVEARARAAIDSILDAGKELNLVVSHGRTLRILMLSLTGLGMDQMTNMGKIPNCGTYILEARRSGPGGTRSYRLLPSCP